MSWRATAHFYGQLRSLLTAGITLDRALELAAEHSPAPYQQRGRRWAAGCREGRSLGEQLAADGERPFPAALVTAGERSGRLPELCAQITSFYEDAIRVRALVVGRAIYPAVLLHLCTMIPVLPLWFLGKAPAWAVLIGPVLLWSLLGLGILAHHCSRAAGLSARLATRWPLIHLARPLVAATSCLVLRAAASAGLLWPEGLRLAAASCGNRVYAQRLERAATDIERERLPNLTAAVTAVEFPREVVDLVAASEEAGDLENGLQRCANLQQERFRARVDWTARVVMGLFYGIAILVAAITILSMFFQFYVQPIREIAGGM